MKGSSQKESWSSPTAGGFTSPTNMTKDRLESLLSAVAAYRVLVLGDAIVDEYCYVNLLGMAAKEPILAARHERTERFEGGVIAAAEHVRNFCPHVDLAHSDQWTVKRRFVEPAYTRKLFEVYDKQESYSSLDTGFQEYDLCIVADFGHGFVDQEMIGRLSKESKFLAVNTQTNAGNRGFNLIKKYKRADFIVLDEMEARLAAHDRDSPIETVIGALGYPKIVVTLGPRGSIGFDGEFHHAPAIARNVVDTMGAGDAFFCITSLLAKAGASMPEILMAGNAAGAVKCGIVGHRRAVTKEALVGYL